MKQPNQESNKRLLQTLVKGAQALVPLLAVILLWKHIAPILLLLVISLLLASILSPMVSWLESQFGGNRLLGVLGVYASIIIVIVAIASFIVPKILSEATAILSSLEDQSMDQLTANLKTSLMGIVPESMQSTVNENLGEWVAGSGAFFKTLVDNLAGILTGVLAMVMNVVLVLVFTFILLLEANNFKVGFIARVPNAYFEMSLNLIDKIHGQVSGYLRGQGIAAATVGVLSTIGLYLLRGTLHVEIPYAFIIGMLAGFANLIPFIGPFVGMIPAILAYVMTPQVAGVDVMVPVMIVVMFMSVQMIDNFFVSPKIMSASVGMHPLMVMVVIMIGGSLMGPLGMLFAVPTFGVIKVTMEEIIWGMKAYHIL